MSHACLDYTVLWREPHKGGEGMRSQDTSVQEEGHDKQRTLSPTDCWWVLGSNWTRAKVNARTCECACVCWCVCADVPRIREQTRQQCQEHVHIVCRESAYAGIGRTRRETHPSALRVRALIAQDHRDLRHLCFTSQDDSNTKNEKGGSQPPLVTVRPILTNLSTVAVTARVRGVLMCF